MYKIVDTKVELVNGLYKNRIYCPVGLNVDRKKYKISLTFLAHLKIITFKNNDALFRSFYIYAKFVSKEDYFNAKVKTKQSVLVNVRNKYKLEIKITNNA